MRDGEDLVLKTNSRKRKKGTRSNVIDGIE